MMKKIICLVLAMLMVVPLLASCGGDDDAVSTITDDASQYTTTLNVWLMTDSTLVAQANKRVRAGYTADDVPKDNLPADAVLTAKQQEVATWSSEEQDALKQVYEIEEAINKLTKSKFKTRLKLYYLHTDEYYAGLENALATHKQAIADGTHKDATQTGAEETEIIDGIPQLKYPETKEYVADIFFLGGYDTYRQYAGAGYLYNLDTLLNTEAGEIAKSLDADFLAAAKINGSLGVATYAIPNYHDVGEYTYLMVREDLLNDYGRIHDSITWPTVYNVECKAFLDYIYQDYSAGAKNGVYPIYTDSADGLLDIGPMQYWSHEIGANGVVVNKDSFSVFGDVYDDYDRNDGKPVTQGKPLTYDNLLADGEYMGRLETKRYYESTPGYVTNDPSFKYTAAACVVKGEWGLREEYEAMGYTYYVMETPRITNDEVYESLFAVGEMSGYKTESIKVLAYLNTNAEIRNLLQYGVEGVNYTLGTVEYMDGEVVRKLNYVVPKSENVYEMDVEKTGNAMIAYPSFTAEEVEALGEDLLQAVLEKTVHMQEKNKVALTDPILGLYYDYGYDAKKGTNTYGVDEESIRIISAVSARVEAAICQATNAQVKSWYTAFSDSTVKGDAAKTAQLMINWFGSDITYVFGGETKTVTVESLQVALECMADNTLADEGEKADDPTQNDNAIESPNAFYQAWLATVTASATPTTPAE